MPIVVEVKGEAEYAAWAKDMKAKMPPPPAPAQAEAAPQQVAAAGGAAAPAAGGKVDGKATYDATCQVCHAAGVAGAPKFGDKAGWAPRIAQGTNMLYQHAIKGFQGEAGMMPPKGGSTAPDADVKAAVDYMVAAAK